MPQKSSCQGPLDLPMGRIPTWNWYVAVLDALRRGRGLLPLEEQRPAGSVRTRRERPRPARAPAGRPAIREEIHRLGFRTSRLPRCDGCRGSSTPTVSTSRPGGSCTSTRTTGWSSATTRRRTTGSRSRRRTWRRPSRARGFRCPPRVRVHRVRAADGPQARDVGRDRVRQGPALGAEVAELAYLDGTTPAPGAAICARAPAHGRRRALRPLPVVAAPGTSRLFNIRTAHRVERALRSYADAGTASTRWSGSGGAAGSWFGAHLLRRRPARRARGRRRRRRRGRGGRGGGSRRPSPSSPGGSRGRRHDHRAPRQATPLGDVVDRPGPVAGERARGGRGPSVSGAALAASDGTSMTLRGRMRLVRQVTVARDRYLESRRAHRAAARGSIVIADRYPVPEIRLMDGPLASKMLMTPAPAARSGSSLASSGATTSGSAIRTS